MQVVDRPLSLGRYRQMTAVNSGPNRFHHRRTVSWQMSMPPYVLNIAQTEGNRRYISTARRLPSGEVLN